MAKGRKAVKEHKHSKSPAPIISKNIVGKKSREGVENQKGKK